MNTGIFLEPLVHSHLKLHHGLAFCILPQPDLKPHCGPLLRASLSLGRVAAAALCGSSCTCQASVPGFAFPCTLSHPSSSSLTSSVPYRTCLYTCLSSHCTHDFHLGFPSHLTSVLCLQSPVPTLSTPYLPPPPEPALAAPVSTRPLLCHASPLTAPSLTFAVSPSQIFRVLHCILRLNPSS